MTATNAALRAGSAPPSSGTPDATDNRLGTAHSLDERVDRLVGALLEGRVVPFLGAGISKLAPPRASVPDASHLPSLDAIAIAHAMADRLRSEFEHRGIKGQGQPTPQMQLLRQVQGTTARDEAWDKLFSWHPHNPLGQAIHAAYSSKTALPVDPSVIKSVWPNSPSLGEVAELCWAILGPAKTCEVIGLDRWNQYYPTAAHHYLAVLVREGLVQEILETNYDEFVELALDETFGASRRLHPERSVVPPALVIQDLESYREKIACPRKPAEDDAQALVKVIKLNGCAKVYREGMANKQANAEDVARKIILTEEQLQSWGDKAWARELLSDRVRSRSLLFIGFGNQDPIVRHHAIAVIREFCVLGSTRDWYRLPNAPFVMAYDPNLSFYQFQLLRAFRDAHRNGNSTQRMEETAEVYCNAFLGEDGPQFGEAKPRLPADAFLRRIVGITVCKLIAQKYLAHDSPISSYLRGALRQPASLLFQLKRTLFEGTVGKPAPFERWLWLENEGGAQKSSAWARIAFGIRGEDAGRAGYRPFYDAPIKQPMLLILLALLADKRLHELFDQEDTDLIRRHVDERCMYKGRRIAGFRLLPADPVAGTCDLYATSHFDSFVKSLDSSDDPPVGGKTGHTENLVVIMLGRGIQSAFRRQKWIKSGQGVFTSIEVIGIGDLAALRGQSTGSVDVPKAKANLEQLVMAPESFLAMREHWTDMCQEDA